MSFRPILTRRCFRPRDTCFSHHISGLPVIDKGNLLGILSEGDFLRRRETGTERRPSRWLEFLMGPGKMAAEYIHTHGSKVSEVTTTEVHTVNEDTPIEKIVEVMEKRRIKRVPVLHAKKVVGIVTRSNLMHAMVSLARTERKAVNDDTTIRQKLLAEIKKEKWALASMSMSWCAMAWLNCGVRLSTNARVRR
jgi:CBS domain-containing protein